MDEGSRSFIRSDYREGLAARCGNVLGVFLSAAREWAAGRSATLRLLLWGYFVYAFVRHLGDPLYKSLFGALNLGVHELGHVIFSPFGQFLSIAAGSFVQCLVPGVSFFMFYRQRDFFAVSRILHLAGRQPVRGGFLRRRRGEDGFAACLAFRRPAHP